MAAATRSRARCRARARRATRLGPRPPRRRRSGPGPVAAAVRHHPVPDPGPGPYTLATGGDGALWCTPLGSCASGPTAGSTSTALESPSCQLSIITFGLDGALWFTRTRDHRIGRMTVTGQVSSFPLPTPDCGPYGIAVGPDGAVHVALEIGEIVRLEP